MSVQTVLTVIAVAAAVVSAAAATIQATLDWRRYREAKKTAKLAEESPRPASQQNE